MQSRNISILGSTGSIGRNTLKVVRHLGNVRVEALAAGNNAELLAEQIAEFKPRLAACADEECVERLMTALDNQGISKASYPAIVHGEKGLIEAATIKEAGTLVSATVGAVGFVPTLRAIESGKRIALANKETLVMAGELMTSAADISGAEILPVDSEHNAIHQCLRGEKMGEVRRIILTASGGPFRTKTKAQIEMATREEALDHPTWDMGDKISIDSATLMNKGLEVIEARWLFGVNGESIEVVVHPQSVVHSMVELNDGSVIAQMGVTDMKHAIQYAITYPARLPNPLPPLDLASVSKLEFEEPDLDRFPNLAIAYKALEKGGTAPAVLNASNEIAVGAFLDGKIGLSDIADINAKMVAEHHPTEANSLESILSADVAARRSAEAFVRRGATSAAAINKV
ncbi:MAG: 1-deoxy-D-xylulose-5-phosphate reductoisomerase [Acidobacteria bacterium]|nr:MAG: 1-deoxy-D-xylulose-5-phosphate reductoisomerase [Acidobacteriota bacterium]REK02059.1 MAG: 1-deoxy-D-xylulose-5-phosphate reductoisomerase [Acidobacteriota bacterium]REK15017.1 MAG: 1-deoxy-D-xylulose-5-phosphate reductoisomerase [Acidobacteriota bacterium]REK45731.1 MAG: 1-deoxy-D-xylulose-5-phosphate reductoisomerase [Acidobacteriota bacterium]